MDPLVLKFLCIEELETFEKPSVGTEGKTEIDFLTLFSLFLFFFNFSISSLSC